MALVRSLTAKYPLPDEGTPAWIAVVDNSVGSPIEQAAMFKVWQEMTPEQRRDFEAQPAGNRRPQALLRRAGANKIIRELTPSKIVEDEWFAKTFARLREYQKIDPELREMLTKTDIKPDAPVPKPKAQDPVEKFRRAPDPPFGSEPLLSQPTTPTRRRSAAFGSVLGRDAPLDPGHFQYLPRRRGQEASDPGVPPGLPLPR